MKKLTAILLVLVMLFSLSAAAMADEGANDAEKTDSNSDPKPMSFVTALRSIRLHDWEGEFQKAGDLNLSLWIPEQFRAKDDMPDDAILFYGDEKSDASVMLHRVGLDGPTTLEEVEKTVKDLGGNSAGIYWINGYDVLLYQNEADDSLCAVILSEEDYALEFVLSPISDKESNSLLTTILCTVQPSVLHVEDAAQMIDADLLVTWGENRHVSFANDGTDITVNMWDKDVTADTISSVNNWDEVKQDKLDSYYSVYADTLAIFGMDKDVELILNFTSPDEQTSFLTIDDGKVTYDVLAK